MAPWRQYGGPGGGKGSAVERPALPGRAVEAEFETRAGRLVDVIDRVRDGALRLPLVDALTGEAVSGKTQRTWFG